MQNFQEFIEEITVQRFIESNPDAPRLEHTVNEIIIEGIVQPRSLSSSSTNSLETSLSNNVETKGEILLITEERLQFETGKPDIIIYDDKKYEVKSEKVYKQVIPHFEYICLRLQ